MERDGGSVRVSVVIPAFNCAATIERTLMSVRAQTFRALEVLVVNDGSRDATEERVLACADRVPGLRYMKTQQSGPYRCRNLGVAEARGEYVAFLDADDLWAPDKLARQVALLDGNAGVSLCHTAVVHIDEDDRPFRLREPGADYTGACFHRLLVRNGITTSAVLVRRRDLAALGGFDEAFEARGDWEMWIRLARATRVACLPEPLTFYREHAGNMTAATDRMRRYHQAIITKNERLYGAVDSRVRRCLEEARVEMHRDFGVRYFLEGDTAAARRELRDALRLRPLRRALYLQYAKASLPPAVMARLRAARRRWERSSAAVVLPVPGERRSP